MANLHAGAATPPESNESMGSSSGLTEALESETEIESPSGELLQGRTAENPSEPASGVDESIEGIELEASSEKIDLSKGSSEGVESEKQEIEEVKVENSGRR